MKDEFSVISAQEMISKVFSNIDSAQFAQSSSLMHSWESVVSKITKYGERLAAHSSPIDLKNTVLLVEADHPGYVQLLKMYEKFILTGLHRSLPNLSIDSLAFRLRGSSAQLYDAKIYDAQVAAARKQKEEELEKQSEAIDSYEKSIKTEPPLAHEVPPEFKAKCEELRKTLLTNSSK